VGIYVFMDGVSGSAANQMQYILTCNSAGFTPISGDDSVATFTAGPMY